MSVNIHDPLIQFLTVSQQGRHPVETLRDSLAIWISQQSLMDDLTGIVGLGPKRIPLNPTLVPSFGSDGDSIPKDFTGRQIHQDQPTKVQHPLDNIVRFFGHFIEGSDVLQCVGNLLHSIRIANQRGSFIRNLEDVVGAACDDSLHASAANAHPDRRSRCLVPPRRASGPSKSPGLHSRLSVGSDNDLNCLAQYAPPI
jgi:hypothetical protein